MTRRKYDSPSLSEFALQPSISSKQDNQWIFAENIFLKILCLERKRSERSGRRFLLMLVNSETLLRETESERILPLLTAALYDSARETDIAGWYREGATLGVIFTEMHGTDWTPLENLVRTRLSGALKSRLDAKQVNQIRLSFHFFPEDHDLANTGRLIDEKLYPDLLARDEERKLFYFVKRSVDIAGSFLALVIGFPLLLAISLAIKLTSKGPILFKQERIGRYGSRFTLLKFRSMKCGNDPGIHREYVSRFIAGQTGSEPGANAKALYKIQDDPRVTRVGRFLRRTSMDELPQFINVLKGEMSLVGPRPPIPYELAAYRIWHRRRVLEAKPGITGLWQVNGRSRLRFDDMVRLDLRYARNHSLWSDIRIILKTPGVLLFCDGAY